jgi:hypothetical protein
MQGIIDADTHISEGAAMWALMDQAMQPRRPIMLTVRKILGTVAAMPSG